MIHLQKKGGWQHEKVSELDEIQFKEILKWLSYISLFEGILKYSTKYLKEKLQLICSELNIKSSVSKVLYDLTVNIGILQKDGLDYYFPHKSLQEYFAALLISELSQKLKMKVYSVKFKKLAKSSMGGLDNFFDLCEELDSINLKRFYLLPCIDSLLEKINPELKDSQLVENFINEFDVIIMFKMKNKLPINFEFSYNIEFQENYIYEYLGLKPYLHYDNKLLELINLDSTMKIILNNEQIIEEEFFSLSDNYKLFKDYLWEIKFVSHILKFKSTLFELQTKFEIKKDMNSDIANKLLDI